MQYQISFQENPPEVRLTVDGVEGVVMQSATIPITESTTEQEIHDRGLALITAMKAAIAEKEEKEASLAVSLLNLGMLKKAMGEAREVSDNEVAEYKAEIVAVEAERLAKVISEEPV